MTVVVRYAWYACRASMRCATSGAREERKPVFKRLDSAYLDPRPSETSSRFYKAHGLVAIYRSVRRGTDGEHICLVGLSFPDGGTDVFVRDEPELHVTEMEIAAE